MTCKLHGRYVQTPSQPCLPRRCCPAAPPRDACALQAAPREQRARAQATLPTASASSSVCISLRPAFLGDNCISVCIDAPDSFQLEQTGKNSENLYLLCAGAPPSTLFVQTDLLPKQLGDGRSVYLAGQARGLGCGLGGGAWWVLVAPRCAGCLQAVNTLVLLSSEDKCLEWMAGLKGTCILNVHSYYQIAL